MDVTSSSRCATQNWIGFEKTLLACLSTGSATVQFRNRAGRYLRVAFPSRDRLEVVLLAHPDRARALHNQGWARAGKGQGPVSRNGRDTGALPGSQLAKSFSGPAEELTAMTIVLLKTELPVVEPRDLHFEVDRSAWAALLKCAAPGHGHQWHHKSERATGAGTGSGSSSDRGPTQCRRCGQHLADPLSISRGYGPGCWAKLHERNRLMHRLR